MHTTLTAISLIGNLSFVGLTLAGLFHARKRQDILKQERALKLYMLAALAVGCSLAANLLKENWSGSAIATFNLGVTLMSCYFTGKQCDRLEGVNR